MSMAKRTLAEELKQSRPFRSVAAEAPVSILRTAHLIRRRLDAIVSAEDLTLQQYNVLRILRGAKGPLPTMEIAERMIEPACGITRLITALEDKGMIRREQWPGDRRQYLCQITAAGLKAVGKLDSPVDAVEADMTRALTEDQLAVLLESLVAVRDALPEPEG